MKSKVLGDLLLEARSGFASGARAGDGVAQVRMNNVNTDGSWDWSRVVHVPSESIAVERFLLQSGDVLFNNTNSQELVGKTALFTGYSEPITFSNHFTRLRPGPELDSRYLALWLHRLWQSGYFVRASTRWVGQAAFGTAQLLSLSVPLPELSEQRRIAAQIPDQLAAVDRARSAARAGLADVSLLTEGLWLPAQLQSTLPRVRLHELADRIEYGWTASATSVPVGPRFLRITDIQAGSVDWSRVPYSDSDPGTAKTLRDGDVVVARTGGTTGKSFLITSPPHAVFASYLLRITSSRDLDPLYLYSWMQSGDYWKQVSRAARGGAQPNLNAAQLGDFTMPLPPIVDQREYARQWRRRQEIINSIDNATRLELEAIDALPAALLRRAFEDLVA